MTAPLPSSHVTQILESLASIETTIVGPTGEAINNSFPYRPADPGSEKCPFFINEIAGPEPINHATFGLHKITDRIRATLVIARKESGPSLYAVQQSALAWRDTLLVKLPNYLHLEQLEFVAFSEVTSWDLKNVTLGTAEYLGIEFIVSVIETLGFESGG